MSFCTMFSVEGKFPNGSRPGHQDQPPLTILYNILSSKESDNQAKSNFTAHSCHCKRRRVCLKDPQATCQVASSVLVKTICFMRSLPAFSRLPSGDQSSLLRHCWVHLLVLGLAQAKVEFEVTDVPNSSILREILESDRPTIVGVHRLRSCLHQLRELDLCPKEYAYLRGALLFNPVIQGLKAVSFVEGLRQEAQRALQEVVRLLHPEDPRRFRHILLAASAIQNVSHSLVTELFFKPVIGNTNVFHLLTEMLFAQ